MQFSYLEPRAISRADSWSVIIIIIIYYCHVDENSAFVHTTYVAGTLGNFRNLCFLNFIFVLSISWTHLYKLRHKHRRAVVAVVVVAVAAVVAVVMAAALSFTTSPQRRRHHRHDRHHCRHHRNWRHRHPHRHHRTPVFAFAFVEVCLDLYILGPYHEH